MRTNLFVVVVVVIQFLDALILKKETLWAYWTIRYTDQNMPPFLLLRMEVAISKTNNLSNFYKVILIKYILFVCECRMMVVPAILPVTFEISFIIQSFIYSSVKVFGPCWIIFHNNCIASCFKAYLAH